MSENQTSTKKLVAELEKCNLQGIDKIIDRAKKNYYHDYKSSLTAPQVQLYEDLMQIGAVEIANKVMQGEFDATRIESDEWMQSEGKDLLKDAVDKR